jgi:hypothetical protein
LNKLRNNGKLSQEDYDTISSTAGPVDILSLVEQTLKTKRLLDSKFRKVVESFKDISSRLDTFGAATTMMAQLVLKPAGVDVVSLVWGSIKFILKAS